jgi:hypothetical protein
MEMVRRQDSSFEGLPVKQRGVASVEPVTGKTGVNVIL